MGIGCRKEWMGKEVVDGYGMQKRDGRESRRRDG